MSKSNLRFNDFVKHIHKNFEEKISLDEVRAILELEQGYNRDSPESLGKSILIRRLKFVGKKISGTLIDYDKRFLAGINVIIADNSKGKSTIFKLIKLGLTGVDSIKNDIRQWIKEVWVEFEIGGDVFTIHINRLGRDKGALYAFAIDEFILLSEKHKLATVEEKRVFEFTSRAQLEERMQDFFFQHFEYYTLKYTHKSSSKESLDLKTGNLSWATYFKSIFLEAADYQFLFFDKETFGSQGRKIFEMILGLPLTYPINMLNIQRDYLSDQIIKHRLTQEVTKKSEIDPHQLKKELAEVKAQILSIRTAGLRTGLDEKPYLEEYTKVENRLNLSRQNARKMEQDRQNQLLVITKINNEITNLNSDKNKVALELRKIDKQLLNMKLYVDTESFFSNLEIKTCPHCDTGISENRRIQEKESRVCSLCGELSEEPKVDREEIAQRVKELNGEQEDYVKRIEEIEKIIAIRKNEIVDAQKLLDEYQETFDQNVQDHIDIDRLQRLQIELERINSEREKQAAILNRHDELVRREAVLEFQLNQLEEITIKQEITSLEPLLLRREIITYALDQLERRRAQINKDIVDKLQTLIYNEIVAFGVANVENVQINEKYDLVITQNTVPMSFSDLNEGEHLRVKLAFYLSLIQLDIEHSLGRHPRFLIFDSPGGEEMIQQHLHGLSDVLKLVNKRFEDKLQIFIGSAVSEFGYITDKSRASIFKPNEFVF